MSFTNHLIKSPLFVYNLKYMMSYFFFSVSILFIILFTTQTNIFVFEEHTTIIRILIIFFWSLLSLFLSRVICYKRSEQPILNNTIFYYEDI